MTERDRKAGPVPTIQRLRSLPEVFDLRDLMIDAGYDYGTAKVAASGWAKRDYVRSAGRGTGVYYNLIRNERGASARLGEAVSRIVPSPVVIGASALQEGGWTTQRSELVEVAIPRTPRFRSRPNLVGAAAFQRPPGWYRRVSEALVDGPYGLPALPPGLALADALRRGDVWTPDPDDIESDADAPERAEELREACRLLDVPEEVADPWLERLGNPPRP